MKSPALVLLLFAFSASAQDPKPVAAAPAPDSTAAAPCVILKRMGPADEITSHLYSFGIRGKQFQYIEGTLPQGISFHGRLTDHDARKILDKGGQIQILEPKYAQADIEAARRQCLGLPLLSTETTAKDPPKQPEPTPAPVTAAAVALPSAG